ncbi:MAG: hypothetical protein ACRCXC_02440 [Legionella sp.]
MRIKRKLHGTPGKLEKLKAELLAIPQGSTSSTDMRAEGEKVKERLTQARNKEKADRCFFDSINPFAGKK